MSETPIGGNRRSTGASSSSECACRALEEYGEATRKQRCELVAVEENRQEGGGGRLPCEQRPTLLPVERRG